MALMYGKQTKKGPFGVILLISVNGILGSDEDFAAVYQSLKAVRNVLLDELDLINPNSRLISLVVIEGALVIIAGIGVFWYKRRRRQ